MEAIKDSVRRPNVGFAGKEIEKLTAFITKTGNDVATLGNEIAELDDAMGRSQRFHKAWQSPWGGVRSCVRRCRRGAIPPQWV